MQKKRRRFSAPYHLLHVASIEVGGVSFWYGIGGGGGELFPLFLLFLKVENNEIRISTSSFGMMSSGSWKADRIHACIL